MLQAEVTGDADPCYIDPDPSLILDLDLTPDPAEIV